MKSIANLTLFLLVFSFIFSSCGEEDQVIPQSASLTVVHAVTGAPALHVDYFGEDIEGLNFSINPAISFGTNEKYTIPAEVIRTIELTYAADTTTPVLSEDLSFVAGEIGTFFILGDSANLSSILIEDVGLQTLRDSLNSIRFINLAEGIENLNIGLADSTIEIASNLAFGEKTDFIEFEARLANESYDLTFKNSEDSVLSSFNFRQWQVFIFPDSPPFIFERTFRKNLTLALVGKPHDRQGANTLQVIRIDNF